MSFYTKYRDEELLKLMKDNDQAAFTELFYRYHKSVYGYLLAQLKTPYHAQDVLHEVFMKIWEFRMQLEIKSSFSAYLFRICYHKVVDFSRKIASDRAFRQELLIHYEEMADYPPPSLKELERMDNLVDEALDGLTPQRRAVFELCRKQGKSYKEVAEELGISRHTVKEHMTNALATLRRFIQQRGDLAVVICFMETYF